MESPPNAAASSSAAANPNLARRKVATKRGAIDESEEPNTKMAKGETEDVTTLANMVAEAVDYTGKAFSTVSEAMREPEPDMVVKTLTPT